MGKIIKRIIITIEEEEVVPVKIDEVAAKEEAAKVVSKKIKDDRYEQMRKVLQRRHDEIEDYFEGRLPHNKEKNDVNKQAGADKKVTT